MNLYTFFANSNFESARTFFNPHTIYKALAYVNNKAIKSIKYDKKKDIISAAIKGSKKYSVILKLLNKHDIEVQCNCPAAREWDSHCKHGAALYMVLEEFFSERNFIDQEAFAYYSSMLNESFEEQHTQTNQLENELTLPSGQKIALANPTIIFIRLPNRIYPRIIYFDPTKKLPEIIKLLRQPADEFDSVIESIFSLNKELSYYIYYQDKLIQVSYNNRNTVHPIWHVDKDNELITISFNTKENGVMNSTCLSLGNFHAIDLKTNTIKCLKVANKNCYVRMNRSLLALACQSYNFKGDEWSRTAHSSGFSVNQRTWLKIVQSETQFALLSRIALTPYHINEHFSFWDYEQKNVTEHLVINAPTIDHSSTLIEKKAITKNLIYSDSLSLGIEFQVQSVSISPKNILHLKDFTKLLNFCLSNHSKNAALGLLINLLKCHQENVPVSSRITNQVVLPKEEFKKLVSLTTKFWKSVSNQGIFKLLYDSNTDQLQVVNLQESDICFGLLTLIEFCIEKNIPFSISQDLTLEVSSSQLNIANLAKHLATNSIKLFVNSKRVISKILDIEIDISSQDNDWFSIHPSFYDKELLLAEHEWKKIITSTGNLYETATEIHAFDQKTTTVLNSLRAVKKDYEAFQVPRLHVFTLLSLYRSGARLHLGPDDKKIIDGLHNFTGIPTLPLPEKLQCSLRDYQTKGYEWLGFLYQHKFGACLADEMGLGKTVQTITFLAGIRENKISNMGFNEKRPHLIVAPASVICNWEQEIKKFYPSFSTNLYIGPQRKMDWDTTDIVLTTYDIIRADKERATKHSFHVIIFDEAQAIKNQLSQKANSAFQLQGLFKVCLTGTPLENNAKELCTIINLALPGLLPNDSAISKLIKKGEYQALIEKISPFILRRTKKEYLTDLPEKTENNVSLEMTGKQKAIYGAITDEIKQQVYQAYREKTDAQAGIVALTALLRLRQICISPALLDKTTEKFAPKMSYLLAEIKKQQELKIAMLIFSQFTGALDILEQYLKDNNIKFLRIDGSVSILQRKKIVEEFQNSNTYFVLILSLKTGGVGLNLTRAQVVYHLDPWWNPAVEDQASDRVHRIGQKNEVNIIRILMKNSIEEKMLILKQKKKELFDLIMRGSSGARGTAITKQDFDFLLN